MSDVSLEDISYYILLRGNVPASFVQKWINKNKITYRTLNNTKIIRGKFMKIMVETSKIMIEIRGKPRDCFFTEEELGISIIPSLFVRGKYISIEEIIEYYTKIKNEREPHKLRQYWSSFEIPIMFRLCKTTNIWNPDCEYKIFMFRVIGSLVKCDIEYEEFEEVEDEEYFPILPVFNIREIEFGVVVIIPFEIHGMMYYFSYNL